MSSKDMEDKVAEAIAILREAVNYYGFTIKVYMGPLSNGKTYLIDMPVSAKDVN